MPSRRRFLLSAAVAAGFAGCTGGESPSNATTTDSTTADTTEEPSRTTTTTRATTETTETTETPETVEPRTETPESEAVRWRVAFDAPVVHSPAVGDGAVYVAVGKVEHYGNEESKSTGALAALGTSDGTPRWTTELPAPPLDGPYVRDAGPYCVSGGSSGFWGIDNRLHGFEPDGTERWRTDPVNQFLDVLAFGGGRAYLGTNDDALGFDGQRTFAVGLSEGRIEWSVETGDVFDGRYLGETLLVAPGGAQAVANHDSRTGERRWQRPVEPLGSEADPFTVADGATFVGTDPQKGDQRFIAVEISDGSERWSYPTEGGTSFSPTGAAVLGDPAGGSSIVVGTAHDGRTFGLSVADGTERWTFDADEKTRQPPVVGDGSVYLRGYRDDEDDVIYALDAESGTEQWRTTVPNFATSLRTVGDTVVVVSRKGGSTVRALDAADGSERWSFYTYEDVTTPVVTADGTVLIASESGIVRAIGE